MPVADADRVKSANMHAHATVAAGFVRGLLAAVPERRRGALLERAGIGREAAATRVPLDAYAALYNVVVEAFDDEGFGLFPRPIKRGTFEFLCRSLLGSRDLGEALERAGRFLALVLPDLTVRVERRGASAQIEIVEARRLRARAGDPRRVFAFEWLLRLLHGVSCWLVARAVPLERVRFPYPRPPHAADYALVYTEHSTFGAPALVATIDAELLDLPVRRGEADIAAFLDGAPGKITMVYRRDRETVPRVREILARSLSTGLAEVARELGLSERTLHRRLRDEGSSFRAVKDQLRRSLALDQLEQTRKPIADIAADLGYSEPSAFFRAFHGWTGEAPSEHRRRHRN
jgi:AraC-like DNA-binding protein